MSRERPKELAPWSIAALFVLAALVAWLPEWEHVAPHHAAYNTRILRNQQLLRKLVRRDLPRFGFPDQDPDRVVDELVSYSQAGDRGVVYDELPRILVRLRLLKVGLQDRNDMAAAKELRRLLRILPRGPNE